MSDCINIIKVCLKHKKKGFIIKNNKKNLSIIKELIKIKVIKFVILKKNDIIGYLNYDLNDKPVYFNIINFFKTSKKKYISIKLLKKLNAKHNWIFLISTNKGIINSYDAIKLNVGGLIIAQLWN